MSATRDDATGTYLVTRTTGEGRVTTFRFNDNREGGDARTNTLSNGLTISETRGLDAVDAVAVPDGTVTTTTKTGDVRWGMQSKFPSSVSTVIPGGPTRTETTAQTVSLQDALDPLSLIGIQTDHSVNGRYTVSVYDAATRTTTTTSPEGRTSTLVIDQAGRPTSMQRTGLDAVAFAYDSRGRIHTVTQGSGNSARVTTYTPRDSSRASSTHSTTPGRSGTTERRG